MNAPAPSRVLTINRGSSTLKAALYEVEARHQPVLSIHVDRADSPGTLTTIRDPSGKVLFDSAVENAGSNEALEALFGWLDEHGYLANLIAAGHRIVHGGAQFQEPQRITPEVLAELDRLIPLDPDHLPEALRVIRFIARRCPELPQTACFDTAFHSDLPKVARMYALPRKCYDGGVRRYGFHGLSYEYVLSELRLLDGSLAEGRVIIAHLGNGASMVALQHGKSVDTSMGFTPLEGLVMGTRSGDVDPGALLYLLEEKQMTPAEMSSHLNRKSGLLGVSGSSADMRDLLKKSPNDPCAAEAVALFCYRAKKYVGAYAAALGGLDLLTFTGGIGEHASSVREKICGGLEFLGVQIDSQRNQADAALISRDDSRVKVRVIETSEDLMIVRHVLAVLGRIPTRIS